MPSYHDIILGEDMVNISPCSTSMPSDVWPSALAVKVTYRLSALLILSAERLSTSAAEVAPKAATDMRRRDSMEYMRFI